MVSTTFQKPASLLLPFVNCYALRQFNTGDMVMPQLLHAVNQYYVTFFLKDKFNCVKNDAGVSRVYSNALVAALTETVGCAYFKGEFSLFSVQLKSNGFFAVFGIPQRIVLNTIVPIGDILGNDQRLLTEQLESCGTISEMATYMDAYLLGKLLRQKHKFHTPIIAHASNTILRNKGLVSLDALAYETNMSSRNFERRFVEEVGILPKLYARITRFNVAVENKMLHPQKKWTDIVYENGFFDQAHFIREVKTFSSKTPEDFFKHTPPPKEEFIGKVDE